MNQSHPFSPQQNQQPFFNPVLLRVFTLCHNMLPYLPIKNALHIAVITRIISHLIFQYTHVRALRRTRRAARDPEVQRFLIPVRLADLRSGLPGFKPNISAGFYFTLNSDQLMLNCLTNNMCGPKQAARPCFRAK